MVIMVLLAINGIIGWLLEHQKMFAPADWKSIGIPVWVAWTYHYCFNCRHGIISLGCYVLPCIVYSYLQPTILPVPRVQPYWILWWIYNHCFCLLVALVIGWLPMAATRWLFLMVVLTWCRWGLFACSCICLAFAPIRCRWPLVAANCSIRCHCRCGLEAALPRLTTGQPQDFGIWCQRRRQWQLHDAVLLDSAASCLSAMPSGERRTAELV